MSVTLHYQFEFGTVDIDMLKQQAGKLADTQNLESNKEYVEAYSGILNLIDAITDYAEMQT